MVLLSFRVPGKSEIPSHKLVQRYTASMYWRVKDGDQRVCGRAIV